MADDYYTKSALKSNGWTDAMIRDLLGEPDLTTGRAGNVKGFNVRYYFLASRVNKAEKTKEFKARRRAR